MMEVLSRMLKRIEGAGLIRGVQVVGSRGVEECVSHLLFADDTILFCDADVDQILHVRMLLICRSDPSCADASHLLPGCDRFEG